MTYIASSLLRYLFDRGVEYGVNYYASNRENINRNIRNTIAAINTFQTNIQEIRELIRDNVENIDIEHIIENINIENIEEDKEDKDEKDEKFNGTLIKKDQLEPGSTCSICLESYEDHDEIALSNCSHHFHMDCIETWMFRQRSCPICRRSI
jgi:hypothetical protein